MELARERRLALLVLFATVLSIAAGLWPELSITHNDRNDNISHFTLIRGMVEAIEQGRNPLDFWSPETGFGYPEIRVYPPLAHSIVAAFYFALGKTVPLMTVFACIRFLSLLLLPVCFFAAARMLGFPYLTATMAGIIAPLIAAVHMYGLEWNSYLWGGFGLFPQAVAANFWVLTIGFGFRAIRRGEHLVLTGVLLACCALSELVYGYMGGLTLCLMALMPDTEAPRPVRLLRLFWVGTTSFLISLFQLLPALLDRGIMNRSVFELSWKWDSFGAPQVLAWLAKGELLDFGRLPILSALALAGAAASVWQARQARRQDTATTFLLFGTLLWILIFFGRPFWGPALWVVGVIPDMPLHRIVSAVQTFLIFLAATGMAWLYREGARRYGRLIPLLAAALLLIPAATERAEYVDSSNTAGVQNLNTLARKQNELEAVFSAVRERGGRTYSGPISGWGKVFNVGAVPMFMLFAKNQIPTVSYLAHSLALPGDLVVDFDESRPAHYRLFDVQSLVAPVTYKKSIPKLLAERLDVGDFVVYDAPGGGYFDVVDAPVAAHASKDTFHSVNKEWMLSAWPDHKAHLVLDRFGDPPRGLPGVGPGGSLPALAFPPNDPGAVIQERQNGDIFEAEVNVTRNSYVLFKMTWHPNWKVLIDGKPVQSLMLSPGFLGAAVTSGRHRIWCRYVPGNWKVSVAFAGLFCILLLGAAERFGHLPGRSVPAETPARPTSAPTPEPVRVKTRNARTRKQRAKL
jgi:hypothetical protein